MLKTLQVYIKPIRDKQDDLGFLRDPENLPAEAAVPRLEHFKIQSVRYARTRETRQQRAALHFLSQPPAGGDDMKSALLQRTIIFLLPPPHLASEIAFIGRAKLRTSSALLRELAAAHVVAASPGETGHIVQCPDERHAGRHPAEERSQIQKSRHPMEIDELRFRHLAASVLIKWRTVFTEKCPLGRRRFGVTPMSEIEPQAPRVSRDPVDTARRRLKLCDPRIVGVFIEDIHPRILSGSAQPVVQAISRARCSAAVVGRTDVQNLHGN